MSDVCKTDDGHKTPMLLLISKIVLVKQKVSWKYSMVLLDVLATL